MRKIYSIIGLICTACMLWSCTDDAVDELTGKYRAPEAISVSGIADGGVEKLDNFRVFTVELNGSQKISIAFTGNRYYLHENSYTPNNSGVLTNNTYIKTASYVETTSGRDYFESGTVRVYKDGDNYRIGGIVWLTSGNVIEFEGNGTIVYIDDAPVVSDYVYDDAVNAEDNGILTHNITLTDKSGNPVAVISVRTDATAKSLAGTYKVVDFATAIIPAAGQAVLGIDLSAMGFGVMGTLYHEDGKVYFITGGTIVITEENGMLSFELTDIVSATGDGTPGTRNSLTFLNVPKAANLLFSQLVAAEDTAPGVFSHFLTISDKEGNVVAGLTVRNESDSDATGEYTVVDALTVMTPAAGQAVPGTDLSAFGLGILGAYYVENGTNYLLTGGKISVVQDGDRLTVEITDAVSADSSGNAGTQSSLSFTAVRSN